MTNKTFSSQLTDICSLMRFFLLFNFVSPHSISGHFLFINFITCCLWKCPKYVSTFHLCYHDNRIFKIPILFLRKLVCLTSCFIGCKMNAICLDFGFCNWLVFVVSLIRQLSQIGRFSKVNEYEFKSHHRLILYF